MKPIENFDEDFDLNKEAPLLSSIDRMLPFEIPANYFDELPMLIQEKCAQQKAVKITLIEQIILILKPKYLAFGMVILLLGGGTFFYLHKTTTAAPYIPTTDDITSALNDNLSQDDESLLIESLPDNSVASNEKVDNDQPIVNYLIDNDVDINTIINNQN